LSIIGISQMHNRGIGYLSKVEKFHFLPYYQPMDF